MLSDFKSPTMMRMASAEIREAREAHAYWSRRAEALPWYRLAARREARELASRWSVRLVRAHLETWRLGALADFVAPRLGRRRRRPPLQTARLALSLALAAGFIAHLTF
jgi:hypothetical protein